MTSFVRFLMQLEEFISRENWMPGQREGADSSVSTTFHTCCCRWLQQVAALTGAAVAARLERGDGPVKSDRRESSSSARFSRPATSSRACRTSSPAGSSCSRRATATGCPAPPPASRSVHQLSPPAGLVAALLTAAPGERLPQLPKPTHVFRPTNLALVAGSSRLGSRREKVKVAGFSIHQRQFETVLEIFRWSSMPRC